MKYIPTWQTFKYIVACFTTISYLALYIFLVSHGVHEWLNGTDKNWNWKTAWETGNGFFIGTFFFVKLTDTKPLKKEPSGKPGVIATKETWANYCITLSQKSSWSRELGFKIEITLLNVAKTCTRIVMKRPFLPFWPFISRMFPVLPFAKRPIPYYCPGRPRKPEHVLCQSYRPPRLDPVQENILLFLKKTSYRTLGSI